MEKIVIHKRPQDITDFMAMEDSIAKNIKYYRAIQGRQYIVSDIVKMDDGTIHYAHSNYTIKRGKKYYPKIKTKTGFTLDTKGKLKVWYGSNIANNPHFADALAAFNHNWFTNELFLWQFMTKTLFEKILTGKITNPIDFLAGYLKLSRIQASPRLLYDACKKRSLSKMAFLRHASVAKDVNHYLEYLNAEMIETHHMYDRL